MGDSISNFFTVEEKQKIKQAVELAERQTSGEIRVHIDNYCKANVLDRASVVFEKLEIHKTDLRNGVLFYLAVKDHKFAILGDAGINQVVEADFWNITRDVMTEKFKTSEFAEGLILGINMAGEKLKTHFPFKGREDVNELSDDISFGKQ
jgi:uncharacterized membrane protein